MADKYPGLSPFVYCANNPVILIDPNGKEIWIQGEDGSSTQYTQGMKYDGNDKFTSSTVNALNTISSKSSGNEMIGELVASKNIFDIYRGSVRAQS